MLRADHERRYEPDGIPMRRYRDFEPRDTFMLGGTEWVKLADGSACGTDRNDFRVLTFDEDQWLCEY